MARKSKAQKQAAAEAAPELTIREQEAQARLDKLAARRKMMGFQEPEAE